MAEFEVFNGNNGDFRFRLRANNGEIILHSEGYTQKSSVLNGITSVKTNAPNNARYTREIASNGQFFFTLRSGNNEVIGVGEMYSSAQNRDNGIEDVKRLAPGASVQDLT